MHHKGFPITVGKSSHRLLYFPVQFLKTTIVHFTQCRLCPLIKGSFRLGFHQVLIS